MGRVVVGLALVAVAGLALAQQGAYSSEQGKYRAKFPGAPKESEATAKSALGDLKVTTATYANSDGGTFLVSFTDFPEAATKPA